MKPIKFKESNKTLLTPKNIAGSKCLPLPVFSDGTDRVSCWRVTFLERLKILFTGKIWLVVLGRTHSPLYIDANCPFVRDTKPNQRRIGGRG